jgi:hypothetical protein
MYVPGTENKGNVQGVCKRSKEPKVDGYWVEREDIEDLAHLAHFAHCFEGIVTVSFTEITIYLSNNMK